MRGADSRLENPHAAHEGMNPMRQRSKPHPARLHILHDEAITYARAANAWTALALEHHRAGDPLRAWDAREMASSYRARIRACAAHATLRVMRA